MDVQYLQTYLRKVVQDFHAFSLHELGCSVRYASNTRWTRPETDNLDEFANFKMVSSHISIFIGDVWGGEYFLRSHITPSVLLLTG